VALHLAPARAVLRQDNDPRHGKWLPSEFAHDPTSEAHLDVERSQKRVDPGQLRFDFDHQQGPLFRFPSDHVDRPPLAADREADFNADLPAI
jgi:hypothetical protein